MSDEPRKFTSWEEVKKAYGWTDHDPIAKATKAAFEREVVRNTTPPPKCRPLRRVIAAELRFGDTVMKREGKYGGHWRIDFVEHTGSYVVVLASRFAVSPGPYGGAGRVTQRFWFLENEIVTDGMEVWDG